MRRLALLAALTLAAFASQACVGKFLSNLLSTENANFKLMEAIPVSNVKILVGFNKPLDYSRGALTLSNYSIAGLNLVSVEKGAESNQVYLRLDPNDSVRMLRQLYTLKVSGVQNVFWDDLLPGDENRSREFMGARWLRATCYDDTNTFTCPPSGTSMGAPVVVTVRGDYAKGTNYRWALYNVTTSSYVTSGLAHSPSAQSPVIDINTTFVVPNTIGTGDFRLEMQIQDSDGAWQGATDKTEHLFTVDSSSVDNIALSNTPPAMTSTTKTAINVVYRNCVVPPGFPNGYVAPCYSPSAPDANQIPTYYKYRVGKKAGVVATDCNGGGYTFAAWSAERAANLPIVETLSTSECYNVQVIAADNVHNYQCDTSKADADVAGCTNPLGPGDHSINDFFSTKTYQESRFLLDTTPPVAVLDTNTLPPQTTSATSFAIVVDSTGLDKYRYRVIGSGFSGAWSTDKNPGASGELITGAGLTNGSYRIEAIGKDVAGNYQSDSGLPASSYWDFTVDTSAPTAILTSHADCMGATGLPPNPTNRNCVDIQVGGTGVTKYKYKWVTGNVCGAGGYGGEQTAATDFITTGPAWADGTTYSLCVIGSNGTVYQGEAETAVTRHTFAYDITPPNSQIGAWVNPATSLATKSTVLDQVSVSIAKSGAEEIIYFKGVVTNAVCPTAATLSNPSNESTYPTTSPQSPLQKIGLAIGTVHICFIARDAAGNWETTTHDVSYTRFEPPAPADGGGANDAQYTNTFNFTWVTGPTGIPTGTQKISVRVCKDAACASPLPGMNNGKDVCTSVGVCDVTSSATLGDGCAGLDCIKQANDASYFAQLKVTDSIGQESVFGPVSDGKIVTGQVTGILRNSFNAPIAGGTLKIFDKTCAAQIGGDVTSAGDGSFTFSLGAGHPLPILLPANGYCVKATSGALQATKKFIEAKPGVVTNVGALYAVDTSGTPGCLLGAVVDGSTGSQLLLANATFTLKDFDNNTVASTPALDPDGKQFVFPSACLNSWGSAPYNAPTYTHASGITPGVYTLTVSIPEYYTINETVAVASATTANAGYLPAVKTFATGSKQIKIILTWGTVSKDFDLHLVGPSSGIDCQPYNEAAIENTTASKFHVSFQQRYCAETGTSGPIGSTSLAVDDSYEYGPEIINFYTGFADGTYKLSVFNNDATALNWNQSKARIDIYAGDFFTGGGGLMKTVLNNGSSTDRGWKALRLIVAGTTLTIDDTTGVGYAAWTYGTGSFTCGSGRINGPSDGLTVGALPPAGQDPKDPNLDCGLFSNGTTVAGGTGPLDW